MISEKWHKISTWTFYEALENPLYQYASIIFILIFSILLVFRKFKKELIGVFKDENGQVQITHNALHELVKKSCQSIPEVFSPTTTIITSKGKLRLSIRIIVKKDCCINNTRQSLQSIVEKIMVQNLNFNNFDGCDIIIKGFQD